MSADGSAPRQFILGLADEMIVDGFAGAGGMSEAIEQAFGRHADFAMNHNDGALSCHQVNHPQTPHLRADMREIPPKQITRGRPVGLFHISPDCTDHSQAKGGQPRSKKVRALTWLALRWVGQESVRVLSLENVKQILRWGPLIAKRDPVTGRVIKLDRSVAAPGERVPVDQQFLIPDPRRKGLYWRRFVAELRALGYSVDWRIINAADFGAPTTRERLFMIARRDGLPVVWPKPTHFKNPKRGQKKWRSAAECIDFSIPCPSIFGRKKDLADASLRRVATGVFRHVINSADPFIVSATHQGGNRVHSVREPLRTVTGAQRGELMLVAPHLQQVTQSGRIHGVNKPLPVITTAKGGEQALCAATLIQTGYGEREGQQPRVPGLDKPLGTVVAEGGKHALVTAFLAQHNTMPSGGIHPGHDVRKPLSAITTTGSQQGLVTAHLAHFRGNCDARDAREPLRTASAGGQHHGLVTATLVTNTTGHAPTDPRDPAPTIATGGHHGVVQCTLSRDVEEGALRVAAFLMRYYGQGGQWSDLRDPSPAITTKDRLALVTVVIDGNSYLIVDIGLRMLTPEELKLCQGFPPSYVITNGHDGRKFTKTEQVRFIGNSVSPPPAVAILKANFPADTVPEMRMAA